MNKMAGYILVLVATILVMAAQVIAEESSLAGETCSIELSKPGQVVIGSKKWTSVKDCSAIATVTRGEKGINVIVNVTDDNIYTKAEATYKCDSVELYFDVRRAEIRGTGDYEKGVFQLIIVPGFGLKPDRMSFHFGTGSHDPEVQGVKSTSKKIKGKGYQMEIFLPFAGFKRNHYIPAQTFNFDLGINDADKGKLQSQLMWAGTSENYRDASKFATITPPLGKRKTPEVAVTISKASQVVQGHQQWAGAKDCSARATITISESGILISVTVTDDVLWTKSDVGHLNDSVELYFDVRPAKNRGKAEYAEGVFQMIIVPGFGKKPDSIFFHYGQGYHDPEVEGVKTSSKIISSKGYSMEIFLPLAGFKENHMIPDSRFNFDLGINDIDGDKLKSHMIWTGTSKNWSDASKFAKIDLTPLKGKDAK